ncbi:MAG: hypothetical protein A2026_21730 [Deltaproteobacteria bacterium RBG_19FT_COMBO_46_12]|nr:MAG: hypothetical protein A2026_21730 [Deltaproteobacteria bacterium RBG_19FT_COMBO_46_12]
MRRKSRQREVILNLLKQAKAHPSAEWIYTEVKKEIPNLSLGTVYRNIKLLQSMGEVSEISCEGNEGRFDGNIAPHYHITCQRCGKIMDVDGVALQSIEEKVAVATGFKITHHCIGFKGICPECL